MRSGVVVLAALLACLAIPPTASALTHFGAPTNQGTHDCLSAQNACELPTALAGSPSKVDLVSGEYGTQATPLAAFTVSTPTEIQGPPSGPLPRIFIGTNGIALDTGATLRRAEVNEGSGASFGVDVMGASMEQDIVNGGSPCVGFSGAISNSLCHATFPGSTGALYANGKVGGPTTLSLRNDTLIGSGGANAVYVDLGGGSPVAFDFTNVIARGPGGAVADINAGATGTTATLSFDHSNYATTADSGGATTTPAGTATNQTATPLLLTDYHELAGSPTIGAGITEAANGPFDLEGNARSRPTTCEETGPRATDIGAYEYETAAIPPCPPPIQTHLSPPDTTITKTTISRNRRRVSFSFQASEGTAAGFDCELFSPRRKHHETPGATFSPCISPQTYKHLWPGTYRFEVRAYNSAGLDPTPATEKVKLKSRRA